MKKSLIALAVAATLVAPAAMADTSNVTVYGQANVSLDMVKDGQTTSAVSSNHVASNSSRLGFKGTEDLGGLSAIFQIESDIAMDGGASTLAGRETFAGVKGDSWGSVRLGNIDSPYKNATRDLDLFGDTIADNRSIMGGNSIATTAADVRTKDTIAYNSPSMSGFSLAYAHAMGAENATASAQTKGKADSFAVMFNMAPFYATAASQKITYGSAGGSLTGTAGESDKAFKVGGGYKTDMFAVNAVIESVKAITVGPAMETKVRNIYVAAQYNISSNDAVKVAITKSGDTKGNGATNANTGARQTSIGYDHMMSKRTTVYALYTKLSNNTSAAYNIGQVASTSWPHGATTDSDPSAISFGLKHSF